MTGLGIADPFAQLVASITFWIAAVSAVAAAAMLVFSIQNLVRAALALTVTLGSIAAIYGVLAADFLAIVQLVVYVGAIMVLIVFAIFMTPGQIEVPGLAGRGQRAGALLVTLVFLGVSTVAILGQPWNIRAAPLEMPTTESIGGLMLSQYVLPFEIVSMVLTVALIGAIVIARED